MYFFDGFGFNKSYPACNFAVIFETFNIPSITIISALIVIATEFNTVVPLVLYTLPWKQGDSLRLARHAQYHQWLLT